MTEIYLHIDARMADYIIGKQVHGSKSLVVRSRYPGNTNQLVVKLSTYAEALAHTGGVVPEFVNPKYQDASKETFKAPTRLECMMQDYPKLLLPTANVGCVYR